MRKTLLHLLSLAIVLGASTGVSAQAPKKELLPNPFPYAANEPMAEVFSLAKSAQYLDVTAKFWMKDSCGSCHANHTYLMARPRLAETPDSAVLETRRFLENRLEIFKRAKKDPRSTPRPTFQSESVGIAVALAFHDAQTTGKLQPTTRQALENMWDYQWKTGPHNFRVGTWDCGCGEFPLVELDRYYVATLAALATGVAPDNYAQSPEANDGLTRLRRYLTVTPAPHLHHQAMLLWASLHLDGLMTTVERQAIIEALLAKQRPDGGWGLASLQAERCSWTSDSGMGFIVNPRQGIVNPRDGIDIIPERGFKITHVRTASAAAKVGLTVNDVLIELNGKPVVQGNALVPPDLVKILEDVKGTAPVDAVVLRNGKKETIKGAKTEPSDWTSDGYGTGFVVYVLRQAGVPANRPELVRGVNWLQKNQRVSGGWFTVSHHAGHKPEAGHGTRELGLLNASASFAVMALHACEETAAAPAR